MRLKKGVVLAGLDIRMRPALVEADRVWTLYGQKLVITSGLEGEHSAGSLHYYGLAFDCRTYYFDKALLISVVHSLIDSIGEKFDVVLEDDHIHVEWADIEVLDPDV